LEAVEGSPCSTFMEFTNSAVLEGFEMTNCANCGASDHDLKSTQRRHAPECPNRGPVPARLDSRQKRSGITDSEKSAISFSTQQAMKQS
jgi:hypothetical protein